MSMSSISMDSNEFMMPPDSPGSSVSTRLQDEYDELLRFAVVVPSYDAGSIPKALQDMRGSFPVSNQPQEDIPDAQPEEEDPDTEVEEDPGDHTVTSDQPSDPPSDVARDMGRDYMADLSSQHAPRSVDGYQQSTPLDGMSPASIPNGTNQTLPKLATMAMGDPLKTKLFLRPDSPTSTISGYSQRDSEISSMAGDETGFSVTIDQDLSRMENLLDQWTGDLKRNVLAEFGQAKIKLIGFHKKQAQKNREKHMAEQQRLYCEMDGLRELLHTYEQSIQRKDQVISNLTHALGKQREKFDKMRTFSEWKICHNDKKREALASKLAEKHYHRMIQHKCWDAWHGLVESRWRERVEKACQSKAQEVCMALTNDYEARITSLNEALEGSRNEVQRLHSEREQYEESMKKAFMRGVCALNMEAMTMFSEPGDSEQCSEAASGSGSVPMTSQTTAPPTQYTDQYQPMTVAQEPVYSSNPPGAPAPRVVTSQAAGRGVVVGSKVITTQAKSMTGSSKSMKNKVVTAKVTASVSRGNPSLAPPMSSVVVERHQPVVKQTVGHATASRYVRPTDTLNHSAPGRPPVQRKIAGQHIEAVKVVE